jgi:hypothetical protein
MKGLEQRFRELEEENKRLKNWQLLHAGDVTSLNNELQLLYDNAKEDAATITELEAIVAIARELRDDVKQRYPDEPFRCPIMQRLDVALEKLP